MSGAGTDRTGGAPGNVLLVVAILSLLSAVVHPRLADRAFDRGVDAVAADVDRLRAAVTEARERSGTWPPSGPVQMLVPDLGVAGPVAPEGASEPTTGSEEAPGLSWRRLESVEVPEPPAGVQDSVPEALSDAEQEVPAPEPTFFHRGAISVRSDDDALLGALMRRYPSSFVHDDTWTLLLPRVPVPPGP